MNKLIELQPNISAWGILPNSLITLVYRDRTGKITAELLYRPDEVHIEIAV